jgi:hypothetical protein
LLIPKEIAEDEKSVNLLRIPENLLDFNPNKKIINFF